MTAADERESSRRREVEVNEQYFDMSVVTMPLDEAIAEIGRSIDGLETLGALLLAQRQMAALGA